MRIIAIGDVVGAAGAEYAALMLRKIKHAEKGDIVIVNAENAAPGNGLDSKSVQLLMSAGADVLTGGNHTLRRHEVFDTLEENPRVLRPLNLPDSAPGRGYTVISGPSGLRILVINALGQVFMDPADNPFTATDKLLNSMAGEYDFAVCDFHAEATSEKAAFARCFDGRIQIVFGTHTHVQTADARVLPGGTGFITDLGMCGPHESILGVKPEPIIKNFLTRVHDRFEPGEGDCRLCGAVFDLDTRHRRVLDVRVINY